MSRKTLKIEDKLMEQAIDTFASTTMKPSFDEQMPILSLSVS